MKLRTTKRLFRAFADETRLRILNLLSKGELCVCDVMRVLKEPQSKVSRHLSYLKRAGLVVGRKQGLWMHYQLSDQGARTFRFFVQGFCGNAGSVEELNKDLMELRHKKPVLVACGE
jgi:ArsR family transcriptional regulator, arsenate/arsenite/antimonite-responsive transcriptional repressor